MEKKLMTVGEVAKKTGVTVRTLQYYDKEGLLQPASQTEGGFRLYSYKEIVKLRQIQSLKSLGFSLADIKNRLPKLDTPEEVAKVLEEQARGMRANIASLQNSLESTELLKQEVLKIKEVNWEIYAEIITSLLHENPSYWVLKYMGDESLDKLQKLDDEHADKAFEEHKEHIKKAKEAQEAGHPPESPQAQEVAALWWNMIMTLTNGDVSAAGEMIEFGREVDEAEWKDNYSFDKDYIGKAIGIYLKSIGYNFEQ